ncbi:MAG: calcium-binding protein [Planctomycetota bacterium]
MKLQKLDKRELLAADLGVIDEGFEAGYLTELQNSLQASVLSTPAPFVGSALGGDIQSEGKDNQFLSAAQEKLAALSLDTGASIDEVKSQLASSLGIAEQSIVIAGNDGDSEIRFTVPLVDSLSADSALDLDLVGADPELEVLLGTESAVDLELGMRYELTFGVRETGDGSSEFFIDTSAADELQIDYTATLRDDFAGAQGRVGVFVGEFAEASGHDSSFSGSYILDVDQAADSSVNIAGTLEGSGTAFLDIEASFFPNADLGTDLINLGVNAVGSVEYVTQLQFLDGEVDAAGNSITVGFNGVELDLGIIYNDFVDPLMRRLQTSLEPTRPVVEFLTEPLPVISDIFEMVGKDAVTFFDLAIATTFDPAEQERLEAAQTVVNIAKSILEYDGLAGATNTLGELFSLEIPKEDYDPKAAAAERNEVIRENYNKLKEGVLQLEFPSIYDTPEERAEIEKSTEWSAEFDGSFSLPFLSDMEILAGFLLGDTSGELMTFGLEASGSFTAGVSVPIAPLLNLARLNSSVTVDLGLTLGGGYDAYGIKQMTESLDFSSEQALADSVQANQQWLLNGFYLDDQNEAAGEIGVPENTDSDAAEIELGVTVAGGVSAGLNLGIASLEVGGEVFLSGTLGFDLNDLPETDLSPDKWIETTRPIWSESLLDAPENWEYDGRIRLPEIVTIVNENPIALTNINGKLEAGFSAFAKIDTFFGTIFNKEWELLRVTLADGKLFEADDAELIRNSTQSELGVLVDGELTLFMGGTADQRTDAEPGVSDERFLIQSLGPSSLGGEEILVFFESPGGDRYARIFNGVTHIVGDAGSGNDYVHVMEGTAVDVTLSGGSGDDIFIIDSDGTAVLDGDSGNDKLFGGNGNDILSGGDGDDLLEGSKGDDLLHGDSGADTIYGGLGHDILLGGTGDDDLDGGFGDDVLKGEQGADILRGAEGTDEVLGGADADTIRYGFRLNDSDAIDTVSGGSGVDVFEVYGTVNNDTIEITQSLTTPGHYFGTYETVEDGVVQQANLQFRLPADATQRDIEEIRLSGLEGDDTLKIVGELNVGVVNIDGGNGDDEIHGSDGNDVIHGGDGANRIYAGAGNDTIHGGDGADQIYAGAGDDTVYAGGGDDLIHGEQGYDYLTGGSGSDTIYADSLQSFDVSGGAIFGEEGSDFLFGGAGIDSISGGIGDDTIEGAGLDDRLSGGAGNDNIVGGSGRDIIRGDDGNDRLFALVDPSVSIPLASEEVADLLDAVEQANDLTSVLDAINTLLLQIAGTEDASHSNLAHQLTVALQSLATTAAADEAQAIQSILRDLNRSETDPVDVLLGGEGNDQLVGTFDADALFSGDGDDSVDGRGGRDRFDFSPLTPTDQELSNLSEHDFVTIGAVDGILEFSLTQQADNFRMAQDPASGQLFVTLSGRTFRFARPADLGIVGIEINLLGGDDLLELSGDFDTPLFVNGGDGNDYIWGSDGADVIHGGAGSDILDGRGGDDEVFGNDGNDDLYGRAGDDVLIGGEGFDYLEGGDADDELFALDPSVDWISSLTISPELGNSTLPELLIRAIPTEPAFVQTPSFESKQVVQDELLLGGSGNDRLTGTLQRDRTFGEEGDDVIIHTGGDDTIDGNAGQDRYEFVFADVSESIAFRLNPAGRVEVHRSVAGETPTVTLVPSNMKEIEALGIDAGGGDDQIELDFGNNALIELQVNGGGGNDVIDVVSMPRDLTLDGGSGKDRVVARTTDENPNFDYQETGVLKGTVDHYLGSIEQLELHGDDQSNGINTLAFIGDVFIYGYEGNDYLSFGIGGGVIDAGSGSNLVATGSYEMFDSAAAGFEAVISDTSFALTINGVQHTKTFNGVSGLIVSGSSGDDRVEAASYSGVLSVYGHAGDDYIIGGKGPDNLYGGDGDDEILGDQDYLIDPSESLSNDYIKGGNGNDKLMGGAGDDTIHGEDGNDVIQGSYFIEFSIFGVDIAVNAGSAAERDTIYGGNGDDDIRGSKGHDQIFGDDGDDTIRGSEGNDTIRGGRGVDSIFGELGNDLLYGDDGNDKLYGDDGDDRLYGLNGNDELFGGVGDDSLYGGSGSDKLRGEDGDDYMDGGRDGTKDYIWGGAGYDTAKQYKKGAWFWTKYQEAINADVEKVNTHKW